MGFANAMIKGAKGVFKKSKSYLDDSFDESEKIFKKHGEKMDRSLEYTPKNNIHKLNEEGRILKNGNYGNNWDLKHGEFAVVGAGAGTVGALSKDYDDLDKVEKRALEKKYKTKARPTKEQYDKGKKLESWGKRLGNTKENNMRMAME